MKDDRKAKRMAQIETAAYAVIAERGFTGTSMLSIAKRAKASNETLYNWYGDKLGLFRAMVDSNARGVRHALETALEEGQPGLETLESAGALLLDMLTGPQAVALNRAAAADDSGQLGHALTETGRQTVAPLIADLVASLRVGGTRAFDDPNAATDLFLRLLIGDWQIRRVTGQMERPGRDVVQARAKQSVESLVRLCG